MTLGKHKRKIATPSLNIDHNSLTTNRKSNTFGMATNAFESLKQLIAVLSPHQRRNAKKYIQTFDPSLPSIQLFELIEKEPNVTLPAVTLKTNTSGKATLKKASRVREKVEESLLLKISVEKTDLSDWFKAGIEVRKAFLQAFIIWDEKREVGRLFQRIEELSAHYECYDQWIEMMHWRQHLDALNHGLSNYWEHEEKILTLERKRDAVNMGLRYFSYHHGSLEASGLPNQNVGELTKMISNLEAAYEETKATRAGYYLYMLKMAYHAALNEMEVVYHVGDKLLRLIEEHAHMFKNNAQPLALHHIADYALEHGDFNKALSLGETAIQGMKLKRNILVSLLNQTYCYLHMGELREAHALIQQSRALKWDDGPEIIFEEIEFQAAYVSFLQGNYQQCLGTLTTLNLLRKDNEGWNPGIRILEMQCVILMEDDQLATAKAEAMRKHQAKYTLTGRIPSIFKILQKIAWYRTDFNALLAEDVAEQFEVLQQHSWQPKSPEVLPFEQWLKRHSKHLDVVYMNK